jgi:hypothetical protein
MAIYNINPPIYAFGGRKQKKILLGWLEEKKWRERESVREVQSSTATKRIIKSARRISLSLIR